MRHYILPVLLCAATLALAGCGSSVEGEAKYPTGLERTGTDDDIYAKPDSIFGDDGLKLFSSKQEEGAGASGIGVNSFLWRASLDTLSFMPLQSADPFGGVIITDWYSAEETPNERFKVNAYILDRQLRADGIRISVFKQKRSSSRTGWVDATVSGDTARKLEDAILSRAREMRVAQMNREEAE